MSIPVRKEKKEELSYFMNFTAQLDVNASVHCKCKASTQKQPCSAAERLRLMHSSW